MLKKRSVIAVPTFISLGLMGSFHAFWGTTLPVLRAFLDLNIEQATVLTAYNQAGQAIACLLGGLLCDLIRRDKILLIGCVILGTGALFLGGVQSYIANIVLIFWMGLGCGLMLSSSNALLVGLYPDRKGSILNIHHSVYGAFSLISPLVMAVLILLFLQLSGLIVAWQASGWISAAALVISGLGFSGVFPSLLALTGTLFFNVTGTSLGVLAAMNWVGGMIIVWMAGLLSQRVSVQFGFVAIVMASLAGIIVHLLKYKTFLRAETVAAITDRTHLKNRILVQDRGGAEL